MKARVDVAALLERVLADVAPDDVVERRHDRARCTFDSQVVDVAINIRSKLLMTLATTTVSLLGPVAADQGSVRFVHRGQIRRGALVASAVRGGDPATALAAAVARDGAVQRHAASLDFTRFAAVADAGGSPWRLELDLMGGSYVSTRIPPSARYNRIDADQRSALTGLVGALSRALC